MQVSTLLLLLIGISVPSLLAQHSTPTVGDLSAHNYLNQVRANPLIALPELNYILCYEFHPVPSPGLAYEFLKGLCRLAVIPIMSSDNGKEFCDR